MAKLCPLPSSMVVEALRVRMPGVQKLVEQA